MKQKGYFFKHSGLS